MNPQKSRLDFGPQPDPIAFLQQAKLNPPRSKAVAQFINSLSQITKELEAQGTDTARFLTVFSVNLVSVKKISSADVAATVSNSQEDTSARVVEKRIDPNKSHPLRQKDILEIIGPTLHGEKFTSYTFQAIVWKNNIKEKPHLCWQSETGGLTLYSAELPTIIRKLSKSDVITARNEYRKYQQHLRASKRNKR